MFGLQGADGMVTQIMSHFCVKEDYTSTTSFTNKLSDGMLSTAALPAKKPRPSGLYGTIPMPSSLNANTSHDRENA
jgi:hypothetical protein